MNQETLNKITIGMAIAAIVISLITLVGAFIR